jgi:hypothetical protein
LEESAAKIALIISMTYSKEKSKLRRNIFLIQALGVYNDTAP